MKTPKVYQLLKFLSAKELILFKRKLNSSSDIFKLFEYLYRYYPTFKSTRLNRETIFHKIFAGENYQATKLQKVYFQLSKKLEDFLAEQEINNDPFLRKKLIARAMKRRGMDDFFTKEIEKSIQFLADKEVRDMHYYRELLLLQHELYFQHKSLQQRTTEVSLPSLLDHLDQYFVLAKLRYACELFAREKTLAEHYQEDQIPFLNAVKSFAKKGTGPNQVVFDIYLKMIQLQKSGHDERLFQALKLAFQKHIALFGFAEQQNLLQLLLNAANFIANRGNTLFFKEQFELYQIGLKHDLMFHKGKIVDALFTNIVIIGSFVQAFKWTKKFLLEYQVYLDDDIKNQALTISRAYLFFHQKKYLNAEKELKKIQSHTLGYFYRASSLILRCYYELFLSDATYFDVLDRKIVAFEKYIQRKDKLSNHWKKAYLNFVHFTRRLFQLSTNAKVTQKQKRTLEQQINTEQFVVAKLWLLEKLKEL